MNAKPIHDRKTLKELKKNRERLRRIESFPYSERVDTVMVSPVFGAGEDTPLKSIIAEMTRRAVSSVIVYDTAEKPVGIITERDIMKKLASSNAFDPSTIKAKDLMTRGLITLNPEDSIYRALSLISHYGIKHLPVVEENRVVGIVTFRQLLKLRHPEPMELITSIQEAKDFKELGEVKKRQTEVAASKLSLGISAYEIVTMISLINQDIHRKVLQMVLDRLGHPPVKFCLFLTGSHGRRENLLTPDQDHGMILEDAEDIYTYSEYFIDLSRGFSEGLIEAGFPFCPGYIMSMNPIFRKCLSEWFHQIEYWIERQISTLGRYATVIFDSYPVYGERELFRDFQDYAFSQLKRHYELLRIMHEEEGSHRVPVGFMGKFITEKDGKYKGKLDIKRSGLIFVVEGIRILALMKGIRETSTLGRIRGLVEGGFIHKDDGEYFESAYQLLLYHALRAEINDLLSGGEGRAYLDPDDLSSHEREMLRHAFKAVSSLQDLVATEFGELVL
ncbi:MAG: CBS domain-containing protein [Nitrospirae bacterium]|nr:MAG: CBS domain-containing protein [Nitrospirota bacterium]